MLSRIVKPLSTVVTALLFPVLSYGANSSDYTLVPLSLTQENTPLVMLAMSSDHQLYNKAYPDFTDLDGDGVLNIRYTDDFEYEGYYEAGLCYQYDSSDERFEPLAASDIAGPRKDSSTEEIITYSCFSGWSGNFLNWATMTRMDMLRHVLYGGKRSTDDTSADLTTVVGGTAVSHGAAELERAYIPNDVHSFVKLKPEYSADDHPEEVSLYHVVPDDYVDSSGVSFCSTSNSSGEPILRAAEGLWPGWSMNGGTVCNFGDASSPDSSDRINDDMIVRVTACADPQEWNSSRCRMYQDGSDVFFKPVGLLQKFGEEGRIDFGLITGSYVNNINGGILRSPVHRLAGNTDASEDEVDLDNGAFTGVANGIINNLNALRLYGWDRGEGNYANNCDPDFGGYNLTKDELKNDNSNGWERQCPDWGNPIGEIFYETLRYFSGNSDALDVYAGDRKRNGTSRDDQDFIANLSMVRSWTDPLNAQNYCAKCATIVISSGPASFDNDVIDVMNGDVIGLSSGTDLEGQTNAVGNIEYNTLSGDKLIANDGETCVEKTMGNLSSETGICPDAPNVEGSYHIAGLAYHANTTDLVSNSTFTGDQIVNTYAIDLADAVPALDFNVNGEGIKLIPACNAGPSGDYHYCSLTDIQLEDLQIDSTGNLIYARLYAAWEDSNWGMDYDLDLVQRIDVCTNLYKDGDECEDLADGEFFVSNQIVNWAGGFYHRASYSISGSTNDGLNPSWSLKTNQSNVDNGNYSWATWSGAPEKIDATYTADTSGEIVESLKKPLYLAAKYGGFVDTNGNDQPDLVEEWDTVINETGGFGSDGIPDNYYKVRNPATLYSQLSQVFNSIIERVSSGSNAAVVANRASGNGSIYQALYYPKLTDGDDSVTWVGQLHSLFVDNAGLIREDTDGDMVLDDIPVSNGAGTAPTDGDFIVNIFYDEAKEDTFFQRYMLLGSSGDAAKVAIPYESPLPLEEIKPIWNGAKALAEYTDAEALLQRDYSDDADSGRYILTSAESDCDTDNDNVNDSLCAEQIDFKQSNVTTLAGYLGFGDSTTELANASKLINYIRGADQTGFRPRQIDMDDDGDLDTWRLGDIIHSTPLVVEKTIDRYDQTLSDDTYKAFRTQYEDRRRMVYVGSNSGMIHAFNGGYWNSICNGFYNQEITGSGTGGAIDVTADCKNALSGHPVGSEMWAYVPRAMLPHLRWQAEQNYGHVYGIDGEPKAFDVRIFDDDDDHPDGWGTILVVPMRQGGGQIEVDHDNDGDPDDVQTMQSSIIVLDITNPEKEPTLIAEISDPNMGLTIGVPALVADYAPSAVSQDGTGGTYDSPTENEWFLVFGSGPYPNIPGKPGVSTSTQSGHIYAYDLNNKKLIKKEMVDIVDAKKSAPASFLAGFESADWDGDGTTDAVYFGSVGGDISGQNGKLFRWHLDDIEIDDASDIDPSTMLESDQPIVAKPTLSRDSQGERWVHFGTGRFYVQDDRYNEKQQSVYGIKEPKSSGSFSWAEISKSALVNAGNIKVLTDGSIKTAQGGDVDFGSDTIEDYDALQFAMGDQTGWYRHLTKVSNEPTGRSLREPLLYQDQLIFSEYLPSADQCDVNGRSLLNVVSWKTGTAIPYSPLGESTSVDLGNNGVLEEVVSSSTELGVGEFSGVTVFETSNNITLIDDSTIVSSLLDDPSGASDYVSGDTGNCVFVQSSTGEMVCYRTSVGDVDAAGRQSWRELEILF